jgi:ABC-type arginine transport system permease subunit
MNGGKHCPACEKDIGLWPVLSAGLPTRVRCPHCKARLTYGNSFLLLLGVVAMVSLVGLMSYYLASHYLVSSSRITNPLKFYGVVVALFLGLWIPVEVAFTLYVRSRGVLKKVE